VLTHLHGYDKKTEFIAGEYLRPEELLSVIRTLIRPRRGDRDLAQSYDITPDNTRKLAALLGISVEADAYDFTIESGYIPQAAQARALVA
jgi:hypothetical protein